MLSKLEKYYNKFNEDKRLKSRHGIVEFNTTMHFINKFINGKKGLDILDVGAGTGAYSIPLSLMGHNVTAVELVLHNLNVIKQKSDKIKCYHGNALNLNFINNKYDIILLLGPMYHLFSEDDRLKVLNQVKQKLKPNGIIFIAYYMQDYAIIKHGFVENNIVKSITDGKVDENFNINNTEEDLYSFVTLDAINKLNLKANLKRLTIFASEGASDYIRLSLNKMDDQTFELFKKYQILNAERSDLLGASSHLVDVVIKN